MLICALALYAAEINGYIDIVRQSAPSNPAGGRLRLYADESTGDLACLDSSGGDCLPSGRGSGFEIRYDRRWGLLAIRGGWFRDTLDAHTATATGDSEGLTAQASVLQLAERIGWDLIISLRP